VTFWTTDEGRQECDLLLKALHGETFTQPASDGGLILERPGLSALAVCDRACLKQLIVLDTGFFLETAPVFLLDGNRHCKGPMAPANPTNGLRWWHDRLIALMTDRFERATRVYRLSSRAESLLTVAEASEFQHLRETYRLPTCFSADTCLRIMLLLHLCQDNPVEEIMEATAQRAVNVLCWLAAERHRVLSEVETEATADTQQKDGDIMLRKIKQKGPVLQRDLFRSYRVQRRAILEPTLNSLIHAGLVAREADGRLRAVEASKSKAAKTSKCVESNCQTDKTDTTILNEPT